MSKEKETSWIEYDHYKIHEKLMKWEVENYISTLSSKDLKLFQKFKHFNKITKYI